MIPIKIVLLISLTTIYYRTRAYSLKPSPTEITGVELVSKDVRTEEKTVLRQPEDRSDSEHEAHAKPTVIESRTDLENSTLKPAEPSGSSKSISKEIAAVKPLMKNAVIAALADEAEENPSGSEHEMKSEPNAIKPDLHKSTLKPAEPSGSSKSISKEIAAVKSLPKDAVIAALAEEEEEEEKTALPPSENPSGSEHDNSLESVATEPNTMQPDLNNSTLKHSLSKELAEYEEEEEEDDSDKEETGSGRARVQCDKRVYAPLVALVDKNRNTQFCSGIMVRPNLVVTAEQCIRDRVATEIKVVAGFAFDIRIFGFAIKIILKNRFKRNLNEDEIGFIKIGGSRNTGFFKFMGRIEMAKIATQIDVEMCKEATAVGYALKPPIEKGEEKDEDEDEEKKDEENEEDEEEEEEEEDNDDDDRNKDKGDCGNKCIICVVIPIVPQSTCEKIFGSLIGSLCALTKNFILYIVNVFKGLLGFCNQNTGTPIICNGLVIGIVSKGFGCEARSSAGVITRVDNHKDFINLAIEEADGSMEGQGIEVDKIPEYVEKHLKEGKDKSNAKNLKPTVDWLRLIITSLAVFSLIY